MDETENELSNVIAFPSGTDPNLKSKISFVHEDNEPRGCCLHSGYLVNEHERRVKCRECGKVLDAFDLMLKMAKRETRLVSDIEALRQEEKYRRENIEKLIQIERNAKARIRRAKKSGG